MSKLVPPERRLPSRELAALLWVDELDHVMARIEGIEAELEARQSVQADIARPKFIGKPPTRSHDTDAGWDLVTTESFMLQAGERKLIPTGVRVNIPAGWHGKVCPRSGLALKHGVTVLNAPGIVDAGYTDEIGVILHNPSSYAYRGKAGDRIAQLLFEPVHTVEWVQVDEFDTTERGNNGFGSTGA